MLPFGSLKNRNALHDRPHDEHGTTDRHAPDKDPSSLISQNRQKIHSNHCILTAGLRRRKDSVENVDSYLMLGNGRLQPSL